MWSAYRLWQVEESDFPHQGSMEEKAHFILKYAMLAPSTFNSQPWLCSIKDDIVYVYLNKQRIIQRSDPDGRFATMSIGAFVESFVIACERFGLVAVVKSLSQEQQERLLLYKISLRLPRQELRNNQNLFPHITQRATNRSPSLDYDLSEGDRRQLQGAIATEGVNLHILEDNDKDKIVDISYAADQRIWSDRAFRLEHANWVRHNLTTQPDGMPGFGVGVGFFASLLAKPVILSNKFAKMQSVKNRRLILTTPYFGVLTSPDQVESWVEVGRHLQRLSLILCGMGLSVAPMGQFIADSQARSQLQELLDASQQPQVFWRIVKPSKAVKHSPRLSMSDIMVSSD